MNFTWLRIFNVVAKNYIDFHIDSCIKGSKISKGILKSFKSFNVDFYLASYVAFTCIAFLESLTHFLSPRFKTLNPKYIILISFNCTCIFYHIQLTRACPSPLAVIWYLCIGFVSNVNKTENLNSTYSQPGQQ